MIMFKIGQKVMLSVNSKKSQEFVVTRSEDGLVCFQVIEMKKQEYSVVIRVIE